MILCLLSRCSAPSLCPASPPDRLRPCPFCWVIPSVPGPIFWILNPLQTLALLCICVEIVTSWSSWAELGVVWQGMELSLGSGTLSLESALMEPQQCIDANRLISKIHLGQRKGVEETRGRWAALGEAAKFRLDWRGSHFEELRGPEKGAQTRADLAGPQCRPRPLRLGVAVSQLVRLPRSLRVSGKGWGVQVLTQNGRVLALPWI